MTEESVVAAIQQFAVWLFNFVGAIGGVQHNSNLFIDVLLVCLGMFAGSNRTVRGGTRRAYQKIKVAFKR